MGLAKNSVLYLVSTICLKAVGFLLLPLYTHLVSPSEYGYVYVVSAFQTFMGLFLTLSMHSAIGRFYFDCKSQADVKQMYTQQVSAIFISATVIVITMLILKGLISSIMNLPEKYYIFAVLISYFSLFYNMIISLLYAMEQAVKISITSIAVGTGTIIMQVVLVFTLDDKALALILAMLFTSIVTFLIFLVYSAPYFVKPKFKRDELIKYYKYSFSQLPSDVSGWFVAASDRLLLNRMQGAYSAGIYGMGNTLGQIPSMLYHSVNKAYVPYVFRHYKEAENGRIESLKEVADTTLKVECIFTFVVVALIILSNNIVNLLESRYLDSSIIMPLVLFAVWIDCNRIIFMNPLAYNVKYIKIKSFIWVLAAILDVCLNFYLIPRYSVYGACASLIISYGVTCLLILYFSSKALEVGYNIKKIIKVIFISGVFAMSYFFGSESWVLLIKVPLIFIYGGILIYEINMQIKVLNVIKSYV
jgi:O-antigen/teichoic acid export membrane protein